jgi:hypothetical protein
MTGEAAAILPAAVQGPAEEKRIGAVGAMANVGN